MVEATDVVFAVDSIPAIFAVTSDPFIVFTSNIFAILGLRALYFVLAGMMDKFRYLKLGLALVLAFVGVKMLLADWSTRSTIERDNSLGVNRGRCWGLGSRGFGLRWWYSCFAGAAPPAPKARLQSEAAVRAKGKEERFYKKRTTKVLIHPASSSGVRAKPASPPPRRPSSDWKKEGLEVQVSRGRRRARVRRRRLRGGGRAGGRAAPTGCSADVGAEGGAPDPRGGARR